MMVLSINSHVVYGHVGAQAMRLAFERLGVEVCHAPTVVFSNHPGHGGYRGKALPAEQLRELIVGLDERGFLARCAALHVGYLGDAAQAEVAAEAWDRLRRKRPDARFLCDPVLGDDGQIYVRPEVVAAAGRLARLASVLTPNRFELGLIAGRRVASLRDALKACRDLLDGPGRLIVCTSAQENETIATIGATEGGAFLIETPRLANAPKGTGDLFAAALLARLLRGEPAPDACAAAASTVHAIVAASVAAGADELALVAAQDALARPHPLFPARPLAC
jgi:pyridoxine kinase